VHGMVLTELRSYVVTKLGEDTWRSLLDAAGLGAKTYLVGQTYPDEEVVALVSTASRMTGTPVPVLLKDFGAFMVPTLVKIFGAYIKPQWKTLDVVEHTEESIHKAVRLRNPGSAPPRLRARRSGPQEVVVHYSSERRMCALAEGIVAGIASIYNERVVIEQTTCMNRGDSECTIVIRQV
jgi:hypothetical protein